MGGAVHEYNLGERRLLTEMTDNTDKSLNAAQMARI